jgi:hypothetical protein
VRVFGGLSLLGLSYFHQQMGAEFGQTRNEEPEDDSGSNMIDGIDKN